MLAELPSPKVFRGDSPGGMSCKFVVVDGVGLKLFRHDAERNRSLATQSALNCMGMAPEPGPKFDIELDGKAMYGHATEVAETVVDMTTKHGRIASAYDAFAAKYPDADEKKRVNNEMQRAMSRLFKLGCRWSDDHPGNFGWIDGHMVILDTMGVRFPFNPHIDGEICV